MMGGPALRGPTSLVGFRKAGPQEGVRRRRSAAIAVMRYYLTFTPGPFFLLFLSNNILCDPSY